ncbi:MAG TPA: HAD family hydrolase, partial [Clostridia bacterium]|nr:HAD family hydrolase [Clostridia bacterium]
MSRKLIATDLDGTILPEICTLHPRTVEALSEAIRQGHVVMIATARPLSMTEWVYDAVGMDTPMALINGALLYHPKRPETSVREHVISQADTRSLLTAFYESELLEDAFLQYRDLFYVTRRPSHPYFAEMMRVCPTQFLDPSRPPEFPSSRLILHCREEAAAERLFARFPSVRVSRLPGQTRSGGLRYGLFSPGADKWNAVWQVAREYGIDRSDIYTFGDEWND